MLIWLHKGGEWCNTIANCTILIRSCSAETRVQHFGKLSILQMGQSPSQQLAWDFEPKALKVRHKRDKNTVANKTIKLTKLTMAVKNVHAKNKILKGFSTV